MDRYIIVALYAWISVAVATTGLLVTACVWLFTLTSRWSTMRSDIEYLKRDLSALMRYFKLTPAEERPPDRRR